MKSTPTQPLPQQHPPQTKPIIKPRVTNNIEPKAEKKECYIYIFKIV